MTAPLKPVTVEGGGGIPPEPDWSGTYSDVLDIAAAHEEWGVIVREMQGVQTISVANGHAIERLVHFRLLYRTSLQQVAEKGAILKQRGRMSRDNSGRYNPHWGVMRQTSDAIGVLEAELGLAPVRRGKATKIQKKQGVARAADNYLKVIRQ